MTFLFLLIPRRVTAWTEEEAGPNYYYGKPASFQYIVMVTRAD